MKPRVKQIVSTALFVIGALASIVGLIVDGPEAAIAIIQRAPSWASNPDVWWVGSISFLTVFGIALVWIPWRRTGSAPTPQQDDDMDALAATDPPMFMLLSHMDAALNDIERKANAGDMDGFKRLVRDEMSVRVPQMLEKSISKSERKTFDDFMSEALAHRDDELMLMRTAFAYLRALTAKRAAARLKSAYPTSS